MNEIPETPEQETIGQRLRRLRTDRGLSQRELSAPGVSYAYISRIEAGTRQPSVKALRKLARKLGVSTEYLETGFELGAAERREMRLADAELELRLSHDIAAAERKLRELLFEAVEAGDVPSATRARIALGFAATAEGRDREAVALLEEATAHESVTPASRADVYAKLGRLYAELGEPRRAVALFERCLAEVAEESPEDLVARIRFSTYLSYALTDSGELDRADEVLTEVVDTHRDLTDPYTRVKLYWSLARLAGVRGQYGNALDHARRAIALLEATEDTVQLGRAHLLCGGIMLRRGDLEEAGAQFELAEQLFGPQPARHDLALLRTEQARRAVLTGQGEEAARFARKALELLGDTDPGERGVAWLALSEGLVLLGELPAAIEGFRRAVECLEGAGRLHDCAQAYRAWGRALREAGREAEALDVLERAATMAVGGPATEDRVPT